MRKSTPLYSRWVANEWRSVCTDAGNLVDFGPYAVGCSVGWTGPCQDDKRRVFRSVRRRIPHRLPLGIPCRHLPQQGRQNLPPRVLLRLNGMTKKCWWCEKRQNKEKGRRLQFAKKQILIAKKQTYGYLCRMNQLIEGLRKMTREKTRGKSQNPYFCFRFSHSHQ